VVRAETMVALPATVVPVVRVEFWATVAPARAKAKGMINSMMVTQLW
jgi:hypothetical protein